MLIGELAAAAGVPSQTVRFYEGEGLVPPPERAANGYRMYDDQTLARLRFIRAAQACGLTLAEVRGVLDVRDGGEAPCNHVATLVEDKLTDVRQRIADLRSLEAELRELRTRSRSLDPADCTDAEICHLLQTGKVSDGPHPNTTGHPPRVTTPRGTAPGRRQSE